MSGMLGGCYDATMPLRGARSSGGSTAAEIYEGDGVWLVPGMRTANSWLALTSNRDGWVQGLPSDSCVWSEHRSTGKEKKEKNSLRRPQAACIMERSLNRQASKGLTGGPSKLY
eukprot:1160180-Pelagomonas_calceolata.AAC.3